MSAQHRTQEHLSGMLSDGLPRPLILTGAPGVGKSSIARRVAARFSRGVHVEADELQQMIVAGGEWPSAQTPEAYSQLLLRTRNAAQVAATFTQAGFVVIVDEVICLPEQLRILESLLRPTRRQIFLLTADNEVILRRDAERQKHTAANYPGLQDLLLDLLAGRSERVDTTDLTVEAAADRVRDLMCS